MPSSLLQKVQRVAQRARQLVRLHGTSWYVAVVCLVALTLGWLDYLVRFEDLGVRLICWVILCATMVVGLVRLVVRAWRYRCTDLQAAHRIEQRFPLLGDRLTSAVAFAADWVDDELAGSTELRRAVIAETQAVAEPLDFDQCINRRQPVRALLAAVAMVAVLVVLGLWDGPAVALAGKRLLIPWGDDHWPRRHVLEFVHAQTRLAVGQDFEIELVDANGCLPDRVEIHYWFDGDDESQIQTQQMQPLGQRLVHRLANVTRSFRYRATGGDDQAMPWSDLTLVEPPRITAKEIMLHAPDYTGLETRQADGDFRALVGTRVTFRVRTSKPLSAASLETDTMGSVVSLPLPLAPDRAGFSLDFAAADSWVIAQTGVYGLRLVDQEGLDVGVPDEWDVEAVRDLPPTVSLRRPAADLLVTARAAVPIEAIAKDDLALRMVALQFTRSAAADQAEETITLWNGPAQVTPESVRDAQENEEGVHLALQHLWDLTELPSMKPGERIDFHVTAVDYHAQPGESVRRRLTIIAPEELEERIARRQTEILAQIAGIAQSQQETQGQTSGLEIQLREAGRLERNDVDRLQVAELNQREVQQRLGHPGDGVAAQIVELMHELRSNRVDNQELFQRLQQSRDTIQQVNELQLPPIQHQLIDALKIAREVLASERKPQPPAGHPRDDLTDLFRQAVEGQTKVVETLQSLLGQFAQWDNYQRLAREVGRLKREQESVHRGTRELRLETLTKDPNDLTAQQLANLKRLSERQNDIALRFNSLTSSMEATQQRLLEEEPTAAATLADAIDMVRQAGIGGLMRDVGREVDHNRLGQATDQQDEVIRLLGELQDILANRRQYQLDRKVQQLRDTATRLAGIRTRHEAIRRQLDDPQGATPEQLQGWGKDESEMASQALQLARQARRLQADTAAEPLQQAGQRLEQAGQAGGAGDLPQMRQEAEQAQQNLEDAQRQLQAALELSQQEFRDERVARLRQTVSEFLSRQQRILDESQQAATRRQASPQELTPDLAHTFQSLADDQTALSREVADVAATLSDAQAFAFALQQTAEVMSSVGGYLAVREAGEGTLQLARQALAMLQQVLQALMEDVPREPPDSRQEPQPKASRDDQKANTKYLLAQLKLIRALQLKVNEETEALSQEPGPWEETRADRQQALVRQQRHLAELVLRLLGQGGAEPKPVIVRPPAEGLDSLDRILDEDAGR